MNMNDPTAETLAMQAQLRKANADARIVRQEYEIAIAVRDKPATEIRRSSPWFSTEFQPTSVHLTFERIPPGPWVCTCIVVGGPLIIDGEIDHHLVGGSTWYPRREDMPPDWVQAIVDAHEPTE